MPEQVSLLAQALPQEVVEFVAACRKQSYRIGAQPNMASDNKFQSGFQFFHDGLVYTDISTEQHGLFSGTESVAIAAAPHNPDLVGQKFYQIAYMGGDTPAAKEVGSHRVANVQHGVIIDHPTLARFGEANLAFDIDQIGQRYVYEEVGNPIYGECDGRQRLVGVVGRELLLRDNGPTRRRYARYTELFTAQYQAALFSVK